jgi:hypothetical protein
MITLIIRIDIRQCTGHMYVCEKNMKKILLVFDGKHFSNG